jgi:hypothetical protein
MKTRREVIDHLIKMSNGGVHSRPKKASHSHRTVGGRITAEKLPTSFLGLIILGSATRV